MKLSYKILSVFGIDIELHLLFIMFILFAIIVEPVLGLLLVLLFFYVTLHELSHSMVAMRHKIKVKKIVLLPFGGIAMMDISDLKPKTEIKMALAGPLFNFTVAGLCFLIAYAMQVPLGEWFNQFISGALELTWPELILFYSFYANLVLGIFNLLVPAFPLDGGRVLRALFALKFDYVRATKIARNIGIFLAVSMIIVSYILLGGIDLWIVIIAMFIIFGAMGEYNSTVMHIALSKVKIKDVLSKSFLKFSPTTTIKDVIAEMIKTRELNALVSGKKIKVFNLHQAHLIDKTKWNKLKIGQVAQYGGFASIGSSSEKVLKKMMKTNVSMLPVMDRGKLVGVVKRIDIERVLNISEIVSKGSYAKK